MMQSTNPNKSKTFFCSSEHPDQLWGPSRLLFSCYQYFWWGEGGGGHKAAGHEVYHPPPSTAKVKNDWNCTSSPTLCLHDMDRNYTIFTSLCLKNLQMKTLEILVNFHDFHITCAPFWIFFIICKG